jgi:hypothetical protein
MARRPIEVFSVSFLDLLSGALGAVILLYVIVPRLTIPVEDFEEQKKLAEEVKQLGLDIEMLSALLPQDQFAEIQQQMQDLIKAKEEIESRITELQRKLKDCEQSKDNNQQQVKELEQQLEKERAALKKCEDEFEKLEGNGKYVLITMNWNTEDDVDLHVIDPTGNIFNYSQKTHPGSTGELTLDNTNGPGLEVWTIINPEQGEYKVYANLYSKKSTLNTLVEIKIYHRNGTREYPEAILTMPDETASNKKLICTFNVPVSGSIIVN